MNRVVGIGANVFDTLITVPGYPAEDTKLRANAVKECGGGPCATGLVAVQKLGVPAAYIGALAQDSGGAFLLNDMKRFGMDVSLIDVVSGTHSFSSYVLLSEEAKTRTCVFHKGGLPAFTIDTKKEEAIRKADVLMIDGNELDNAIVGAKIARESGTKVLYDAGGLYDGIEKLLPFADILIPSEEFSLKFTGCENAEEAAKVLFTRFSPEVIVITQGKRGGLFYDGSEIRRYPMIPAEVVDSNGAGDVFHGAFAVASVKGFSLEKACIFSSAVSALKCTKLGARDGVPGYNQTIKYLKECGYHEFEKDLE